MQRRTLWTASASSLGLFLVVLVVACSRDAVDLPGGSSAMPSSSGMGEMGRVAAQSSNGNDNDTASHNDDDNIPNAL